MKTMSKVSLTLFSLLALSGISASANQRNNNANNNTSASQTQANSQNNDNQDSQNNQSTDNGYGKSSNSSSLRFVKVNQLNSSDFTGQATANVKPYSYHKVHHHSNNIAKQYGQRSHKRYNKNYYSELNFEHKFQQNNPHINNHRTKRNYHKSVTYHGKRVPSWFIDGLSHRQLRARGWIVRHESGGHWNILSYGHVCVGRYQLAPGYLGYKHGRVNLGHRHQTLVADRYVRNRYGCWVFAKRFWQSHHWY